MTKESRRSEFVKDRILDLGVVRLGRKKLERIIYWRTENWIGFFPRPTPRGGHRAVDLPGDHRHGIICSQRPGTFGDIVIYIHICHHFIDC